MSNHITIQFCEEDRQRLDLIASLLTVGIDQLSKGCVKPEPVIDHPVDEVSPHAPEPVEEPAAPKATKDDVQALVIKLAAPDTGKKDAVKAIVNEYAKKVSEIPEDKLDEVMDKLNKLAKESKK